MLGAISNETWKIPNEKIMRIATLLIHYQQQINMVFAVSVRTVIKWTLIVILVK